MKQTTTMQTLTSLQSSNALQADHYNIAMPFHFTLPDGSELFCTDMLRFLPGKRMVMRAEYGGNVVLAKLFFDTRNWQKELDGYAMLHRLRIEGGRIRYRSRFVQSEITRWAKVVKFSGAKPE